jgi:hypothetical protein
MNKDNDAFFNARKSSASHIYAGVALGIGSSSDWIPDLIEVVIDESGNATLRLIELEAHKSDAVISSRKYLPENSTEIVTAFLNYLEKVIRACRSSADNREEDFARLKMILSKTEKIFITSAGALRSSAEFVEELPLLDQPNEIARMPPLERTLREDIPDFSGTLRLSGDKAAALGRAILILDAVIRKCDHSDAAFKTWRAQDRSQPLKKLLKKNGGYPCLRAFISQKSGGTILDYEKLLSEVREIWSNGRESELDKARVRILISRYFPIATKINARDRMPAIFDGARSFLAATAT